jgi:hypothetical protein
MSTIVPVPEKNPILSQLKEQLTFKIESSALQKLLKTIKDLYVKKLKLNGSDMDTTPAAEASRELLEHIIRIANISGPYTQTKEGMQKLAEILIQNPQPIIIAPACPDYSHQNGQYDFEKLHSGVSLLAQLQIQYLQQILQIIPGCKPIILLADGEVEDEAIRRKLKESREGFLKKVSNSLQATRAIAEPLGIQAEYMTAYIPNILAREKELAQVIEAAPGLRARVVHDTLKRRGMYRTIDPCMSVEDETARTLRTSAQYLAVGEYATQKSLVVSNHTTTNLAYYLDTRNALLHNPVKIY